MRIRAIFCCLYFSIVPWWVYEQKIPHYKGISYWQHLKINFKQIWGGVSFQETEDDIVFEKSINSSWRCFLDKSIRFTKFRQSQHKGE